MAAPTGASRILQIHPTRRCNLRCRHCYSVSGPEERDELEAALLRQAISDASLEGFTVASFSGGEPLLYKPLRDLLDRAHECGMVTTVTTNGMLLDARRLKTLAGGADLIAVSLDGVPESHNRVRANARAFEAMKSNLAGLRATGIPFGFIFTLTQYNLNELEWVAEFALEQGAQLLQVHPLEEVGRARETMTGERPDETESAYAFVEVARIEELAGERMVIQLDLSDREYLIENREKFFAETVPDDPDALPFAELVSPVVIEPDGMVVPIEHGFARRYALGNLREMPLDALMARWRRESLVPFRGLCQQVFSAVTAPTELPLFNWYESLGRMAAGRGTS
ncbi:MAG TPA: radical SAM protein [Blastocatellia bacterium]|nr:radical SAM protein [Blastocatellia bacterium]